MLKINPHRALAGCVLALAPAYAGCGDAEAGDAGRNLVASGAQALLGSQDDLECRRDDRAESRRDGDRVRNLQRFQNVSGRHATFSTRDGRFLDTDNAFFQSLGTNGRTCESCHAAEGGFSVSAANVQKRFRRSCGLDPIFRAVDGANSPTADVSTLAKRREAYSLLLGKGLIRIQEPIPANAEFELTAV